MPKYPLDRRILELILNDTGTTNHVNLDADIKATGRVFEHISQIVATEAWSYASGGMPYNQSTNDYTQLDKNTWKRVFGHNNMDAGKECSGKTLKQIAHYLEYPNWENLIENLEEDYAHFKRKGRISNEDEKSLFITSDQETQGLKFEDRLEVTWDKGKRGIGCVKLTYLGYNRFRVNAKYNCSLEPGCEFSAKSLTIGLPFIIELRGGQTYSSGVNITKIIRKKREKL
ncbi:MAG: hypothetical protein IJZ68_00785 [Bacteroidaceae bacterium]|nr:hypothetical protein [Bacteroidaceae bacterium]